MSAHEWMGVAAVLACAWAVTLLLFFVVLSGSAAINDECRKLRAERDEAVGKYLRVVHPSSRGVAAFEVFRARREGFARTADYIRGLPELGGDAS